MLGLLSTHLDKVVFTGYSWGELQKDPAKSKVLKHVDLIVAGRFNLDRKSDENRWRGSDNKTVHALSGRIRADEFPESRVEALIGPNGQISITGFPPMDIEEVLWG